MTVYELWFQYGRLREMSPTLLVPILQDANLIRLTNIKGEIQCELLTKNPMEDTYKAIKEFRGLWLHSQLWYYFKAVRRWKSGRLTQGL